MRRLLEDAWGALLILLGTCLLLFLSWIGVDFLSGFFFE